jgi:hypothetical protein
VESLHSAVEDLNAEPVEKLHADFGQRVANASKK